MPENPQEPNSELPQPDASIINQPPIGGVILTQSQIGVSDNQTQSPLKKQRLFTHSILTGRAAKLNASTAGQTPTQLAIHRFCKNRLAVFCFYFVVFLYTIALFAPFVAPYTYDAQSDRSFAPPATLHWDGGLVTYQTTWSYNDFQERIFKEDLTKPQRIQLFATGPAYRLFGLIPMDRHLFGTADGSVCSLAGTDELGRDYLTRVIYGSQISLSVGILAVILTFAIALPIGGISGFYGGRVDDVIMRFAEVVMSVPDLYLLIALAAFLPPNISPTLIFVFITGILSVVGWAGLARIIRGMVLSIREREYIEAARALGVSNFRTIVRHVIPSTFTFVIVAASLSLPGYMLSEAALSFLGVGIRDPVPSWGNMLSAAENISSLTGRPWILIPGLLICVTTLAINVVGDALRDAVDPKTK